MRYIAMNKKVAFASVAFAILVIAPSITGGGIPAVTDGNAETHINYMNNETDDIPHFYSPLTDCFNRGEGEIIGETALASSSVMLFDYDNDGDMDFIIDTLLYVNCNGKYEIKQLNLYNENPVEFLYGGMAHADFNNDGKEDFVTGGINGVIRLFINNCSVQDGEPRFEMHVIANLKENEDMSPDAYGLTSADFNKDGNMDFAVSYRGNTMFMQKIDIFYNNGSLGFARENVYAVENDTRGDIRDLESGDFDNDGDIDIIFTYDTVKKCYGDLLVNNQGVASIIFNDGKNNFGNETMIALRGCPILIGGRNVLIWREILMRIGFNRINPQLTCADYDTDGDIDFLWGDNSGKVEMFENDGMGNFTSPGKFVKGIIHDFGRASWGLDSADFDNDGDIDFIVVAANMKELRGYAYLKINQIQ